MTPAYTLRPATDADHAWLRWLHHATMREAVESMWGWDDELQDALFDEKFTPENHWIVEVDGHDVGLIAVSRRASEYVLDNIQITPAHQGMGLGTGLIREVQDRAWRDHVPVRLGVIRSNRARDLYERLGFVVTDESDTHYFMRWPVSI